MMKVGSLLLIVLSVSATASCSQDALTSCVVDEATRDAALVTGRSDVLAAIRSRNFERLRPLLAEDIDASEVGGTSEAIGPDAFKNAYGLGNPSSSYWQAFERPLLLGGRFEEAGTFCAPYYSCPEASDFDPDSVVVLGTNVPAHSQPSDTSVVVTRLSCTTVETATSDLLDSVAPAGWVGVVVPEGRLAFVRTSSLAAHDFYMRFQRRGGRWVVAAVMGFD